MTQTYNADVIEVLTGLEPIRRRPGMYTSTTRPNHFGQGVIDNGVSEVLAGRAKRVDAILCADRSLEVIDNGRSMPVDIHPEESVPAVKLISCRLHAGDEFSSESYQFFDGLHGVGISAVSALPKRVGVSVYRGGQVHNIAFENGDEVQDLQVASTCDKCNTGTSVYFQPDENFSDSPRFSVLRLTHVLKARAVLCPGIEITLEDEVSNSEQRWCYQDGLDDCLSETMNGLPMLPEKPFIGSFSGETETMDWALLWLPEDGESLTESYVNLILTMQGGTHANGLCQELLDAMCEFYEYRNILLRGVELSAEDIQDRCAYVLSVKIQNPQLVGQTKERLSSRQCAAFVSGVVKDAFSLWLNQNVRSAELLIEVTTSSAQRRLRAAKKVIRKKLTSDPAPPGKLADCTTRDLNRTELFLVEDGPVGELAKQARDREYQAIMSLKGRILNTRGTSSDEVLASQEVHDISVAVGIDPDSDDLSQLRCDKICILANAGSDGLHITTLLYALFVRHPRTPVKHGHAHMALPPLYRIDLDKEVYYALTEEEKADVLEQLECKKGKSNVQRFKGLDEVNPMWLRETALDPNTRRLMQLIINDENDQRTNATMGMLLAEKCSEDRRNWLQEEDDLTDLEG